MLLKKIIELKKHWLFFIFISFVVFLVFLTYKNYGITWDEGGYIHYGKHYTIQILNALKIPHNLIDYNFDPNILNLQMQSHGAVFDVLIILLTPFFRNFNFEIYHLIKALLSLLSFIFLYKILSKLLSNKWALFGSILLLLFPHFYGDIYNNSIDVPSLMFFTFYVSIFIYFLDKKNSIVRQVLLSLSMAILINQRIVFLYVFILTCAFLIKKPRLILFLSFLTFVFLHLTSPYLWQHPIVGFFNIVKASNSFPFTAANLFEGKFIPANQIPWYYIPKLMVITTPLSTLGLFLIGNFYLVFSIFSKKYSPRIRSIYAYFLALFYIPLVLIFVMRPALYDSWRHFLFLTIPMIIIAVFGAYAISKIKNNLIKFILFGLVFINLIQTGFEMKALHPYQYIYYNSFVGGLKGANGKYETDYWGAGNREAVEWFNKNINDPKKIYYIITEGDPLSSTYYFKKNMFFTFDYNHANYAISFTRWNSDQKYSGKIIYTVEREGVPLIYIKKNP